MTEEKKEKGVKKNIPVLPENLMADIMESILLPRLRKTFPVRG